MRILKIEPIREATGKTFGVYQVTTDSQTYSNPLVVVKHNGSVKALIHYIDGYQLNEITTDLNKQFHELLKGGQDG